MIPSWKEASFGNQEKEMVKKIQIENTDILELTITIPLQLFAYALP